MKYRMQFNEQGVELEYEYTPVAGSGNALIPTRYRTNIWIISGGKPYDMGYWDEKLDEEQIKARFGEIVNVNQERQYGTQGTVLRRELSARRDRGEVFAHGSPANLRSRTKRVY